MTDKVWSTKKEEFGRNTKEILVCGVTLEGKGKTHISNNTGEPCSQEKL